MRASMPKARRNGALRHRSVDRGTARPGSLGERPEIDLGREIGLARRAERIGQGAWPRTACRVSPVGLGPGAVVDQQRDAALRRRCAPADRAARAPRAPG